jgi:hypothetical protein
MCVAAVMPAQPAAHLGGELLELALRLHCFTLRMHSLLHAAAQGSALPPVLTLQLSNAPLGSISWKRKIWQQQEQQQRQSADAESSVQQLPLQQQTQVQSDRGNTGCLLLMILQH